MTNRASLHLPPNESSGYVRIEVDGKTAGFLKRDFYDLVYKTEADFAKAMETPGAEEEPHSQEGRWVVRLRGEHALAALHAHLSTRD